MLSHFVKIRLNTCLCCAVRLLTLSNANSQANMHPYTPTTQVAQLTDADIARMAERKRMELLEAQNHMVSGQEEGNEASSLFSDEPTANVSSSTQRRHKNSWEDRISAAGDTQHMGGILLGVPVATGPNVTKFFYVRVPTAAVGSSANGTAAGAAAVGDVEATAGTNGNRTQFDAEAAASELCTQLRSEEKEEPPACLASLALFLASRLVYCRFLFHGYCRMAYLKRYSGHNIFRPPSLKYEELIKAVVYVFGAVQ